MMVIFFRTWNWENREDFENTMLLVPSITLKRDRKEGRAGISLYAREDVIGREEIGFREKLLEHRILFSSMKAISR